MKYRCNSPTGYVRPFKKSSCFRPLRGRGVGVFDTPLQPGTCEGSKKWICIRHRRWRMVGRMRYAPTTGYVRGFKKWICICHRRWRMVGRIRYAPTTGYVRSFEIQMQFSNWVRTILRNTDAIPQLGTCCPSKKCPVFVPFGAVCGAYAIRPYDRVCAALQKTVPFSSPSGPLVGRMRYAPTIGYV